MVWARSVGRARRANRAFTLIELVMALAVFGLIAVIAVPAYHDSVTKARNAQAIADIAHIDGLIERHRNANGFRLPATLAELGTQVPADPWGRPYVYLNIEAGAKIGQLRKDKNLVPLNSDYDLYSKGADGKSVAPLTAAHSRDDIVRAGNGSFIGLGRDH